jgi:hypothetical protein
MLHQTIFGSDIAVFEDYVICNTAVARAGIKARPFIAIQIRDDERSAKTC